MAANPISATEIKSHWRQYFSPSLTNNGLRFGLFMKKDAPPKTLALPFLSPSESTPK